MSILKQPSFILKILILVAAAYWLWYGISERSISADDGISIIAAEGILQHGLPQLPSGFLYNRAYLPNYLQAASIGAFGLNHFSILLVNLLMALGSMCLTYLIARDVTGKPWLGVIAATLLVSLQAQTIYATGPRMYMAVQMFITLAVYSAWKGYVFNSAKFQLITLLAICAAILSHQLAGLLLVAIPGSLALVTFVQGRMPTIHIWQNVLGFALVASTVYFLYFFDLPNEIVAIAIHSGQELPKVGFQISILNAGKHLLNLERTVPSGMSMVPVMVLVAVSALLRRREHDADNGVAFLVTFFTIAALSITLVLITTGVRFWLPLLPIYVVLIVLSLATIISAAGSLRNNRKFQLNRHMAIQGAFALGILGNIFLLALAPATSFAGAVGTAYGKPNQQSDWQNDIRVHHGVLQSYIESEDLIVSSNPWVSYYYLRRIDGFLREKNVGDGQFSSFGDGVTDEYFGVPMIDSQIDLEQLLDNRNRVWIITDAKLAIFSSQDTRDFIQANYAVFHTDDFMTTYVNCSGAGCPSLIESRGSIAD